MTRIRQLVAALIILSADSLELASDARADNSTIWQELNRQGAALNNQGRFEEAIKPLTNALTSCDSADSARTHCIASVASNLCVALLKLGRTEEGMPTCLRSLDAFKIEPDKETFQQRFHGDLFVADALEKLRRVSEAESLFRDAATIAANPAAGLTEGDLGMVLYHLAVADRDLDKLETAAGEYRDAANHLRISRPDQAIQALGWLQDTLWRLGRDLEAEAAGDDAVAVARGQAQPDPKQLIAALGGMARFYGWGGRLPEAEAMLREDIETIRKNSKPNDLILSWQLRELAEILADSGRAAEALDIERQALAQYEQYAPKVDEAQVMRDRVAYMEGLAASLKGRPPLTQVQLAAVAQAERLGREADQKMNGNRWSEAEDLMRKSLALAESVLPRDSQRLGQRLYGVGLLLENQERYAEAEPYLSRCAEIFKANLPYQLYLYAKTLEALGTSYENLGEAILGETRLTEAISLFEKYKLSDGYDGIRALHNYGAFLRGQSRFKEAEDIFQRILALREKSFGHDQPPAAVELNSLGYLYRQWGRYAESETALARALAIQEKAGGQPTETNTFVLINLASLNEDEGRYAQAEDFHRRALALREGLYGKGSAQVARTLRTIAEDKLLQWQLSDAEDYARRAIALGETNGDAVRYQTAAAWRLLGRIQASRQHPDDAVSSLLKAVALDEKLVHAEQRGLLDSLFGYADALFWAGRYAEAIRVADRALEAAIHKLPANAPASLAWSFDRAAEFRALAGYSKEATELVQNALAIRAKLFGEKSLAVAYNDAHLVPFMLEQGRAIEAERLTKEALALAESTFGGDSPNLAPFLRDLASVSGALGRTQVAEFALRRALRIQEANLPSDSPVIVSTITALANNLAFQGRAQDAEPLALRALNLTEAWSGSDGPALVGPLECVASVLSYEGKGDEAAAAGHRALDIALRVYGPSHPATAEAMRIVGNALARTQISHAEARKSLEGAVAILQALPTPVNFWLAASLNDLALVEEADGELAEAADHLRQAVAIYDRAGFVDSLSMAVGLWNLTRVDLALGLNVEALSASKLATAIFLHLGIDGTHHDRTL